MMAEAFEPIIVGFVCNWCSFRAADSAGTARMKYPPNIRLIRLMCSGRLDPTFVMKALVSGADGVMVGGCHLGDCHYVDQNYKTMRRFKLLKRTLVQMGVEPDRIKLVWASASESRQLVDEFKKFTEEVRALGPLHWGIQENQDPFVELDIIREAA
jgi:F420-non-reducing hydrogenase iron-sulfur subunit